MNHPHEKTNIYLKQLDFPSVLVARCNLLSILPM